MIESPILQDLITALCCMPGIGRKSAQRIAYHLLQRDRDSALNLADVMRQAMTLVGNCRRCRNFSETEICALCSNGKRDHGLLCVVENPADIIVIEQSDYRGLYFVLMGHLSPLDGIGPDEIGFPKLVNLINSEELRELILATTTTVEGEATAHLIGEVAKKHQLKATRIAYGIPIGGGLDYINNKTITHAMAGRQEV